MLEIEDGSYRGSQDNEPKEEYFSDSGQIFHFLGKRDQIMLPVFYCFTQVFDVVVKRVSDSGSPHSIGQISQYRQSCEFEL